MLTTQDVGETTADMPQCTYEVLKEGPGTFTFLNLNSRHSDGLPVAFARIGDSVYHKWSCVGDATKYCITVHTCVVDDGQGEKRVLLDEQGCAQDQYLLDNLQYPTALMAGQVRCFMQISNIPGITRIQIRRQNICAFFLSSSVACEE